MAAKSSSSTLQRSRTHVRTGSVERPPEQRDQLAVVVCHGMGQQVPFETVDLVARCLREAEAQATKAVPEVLVDYVRLPQRNGDPQTLPRATLTLTRSDGTKRDVDLFEAYWAPLTEGKVKDIDVVWFLLQGGWNGIRYGLGARWKRWMFGESQEFSTHPRTALAFAAAFFIVFSLLVINAITAAVAAARLTVGATGTWPSDALLRDLTVDIWIFLVAAVMVAGGTTLVPGFLRSLGGGDQRSLSDPWRLNTFSSSVCWALVFVGLILTVGVAVLLVVHLGLRANGQNTSVWAPGGLLDQLPITPILGTWLFVFLVSWVARWFFVQYLGDVAAYVSFHTVNEYWEIRTRIKEASVNVARAVYGASAGTVGTFQGALQPRYAKVVVVGHSLGSVVAYDTLNALIQEDLLEAVPAHRLDVAARTAVFVTLGSPLDKTAFVFTMQERQAADVRETLAAATQPMITSYGNRPDRWVNIWSRHDWIGGSLDFYDDQRKGEPGGPKRVSNVEDLDSRTPLTAHNEYWSQPTLLKALYSAATAP